MLSGAFLRVTAPKAHAIKLHVSKTKVHVIKVHVAKPHVAIPTQLRCVQQAHQDVTKLARCAK